MVKFLEPRFRRCPPLHKHCISNEPLETRLVALHEAIAAGEDPNELGGWKDPGIARPLHYAIDDSVQHDLRQLKQNLPVVQLLLQAGADPRLPCITLPRRSPIEELEVWIGVYKKSGHSTWEKEFVELYPFYEDALLAMKKVAAELDAKDAALERQIRNGGRSWLSWLDKARFW
ncbi:hypothetical protein C7974DRAFT_184435 [Boeremia exigua]|uniref:uncharacterized protein n=1 Tax=Boeremia exigua TaxID=749465 RepID=UPI001E8E2C8B|nr:uncharacterized protein C7974DRAFT_184435 [Boeremia exigua]KAH6629303.1 hypothetical protein C7974DRAFT_184435 [Boeremia exigua]